MKTKLSTKNIQNKFKGYAMKEYGLIMHKNGIYVPSYRELRNLALKKMHSAPCARRVNYHKTIAAIRSQYFWKVMKKDFPYYITICMEC